MITYTHTERLILREISDVDAEGIFTLDSDAEVHRFLGNRPIHSIEQAQNVVALIRQQYKDNGIGRWAVIEKASNQFIGWAGLKLMKEQVNGFVDFYEVGYRLIRKYWGKGYATEAAKASIAYGFSKMDLPVIYAMADTENYGSCHVLEKAGLNFIETFDYDGTPHNWYILTKGEFAKIK